MQQQVLRHIPMDCVPQMKAVLSLCVHYVLEAHKSGDKEILLAAPSLLLHAPFDTRRAQDFGIDKYIEERIALWCEPDLMRCFANMAEVEEKRKKSKDERSLELSRGLNHWQRLSNVVRLVKSGSLGKRADLFTTSTTIDLLKQKHPQVPHESIPLDRDVDSNVFPEIPKHKPFQAVEVEKAIRKGAKGNLRRCFWTYI